MGMTFISRTSIPVPIKGKAATEAQVTISESGQMIFSTLAVKALGGKELTRVGLGYDKESRVVSLLPKGNQGISKRSDEQLWTLKHSTKGNSATLSGSASFLNNEGVFKDAPYDFKTSGGQTLKVTAKDGYIFFTLPKGALPRRPTVKRVKKAKVVTPITGASASAPAAGEAQLEELQMESA